PEKIKRLAVMNFAMPDDAHLKKDLVSEKFTTALVGSPFKLVDRTDLKKIMVEVSYQSLAEGIIDDRTKERLRHLGADSIMTGTLHSYIEKRGPENLILYAEVYLTAKILKVETGEVMWSAEIMKQSKAKNVGKKKLIGGESEAVPAGKLLDEIVSEMAGSFAEKKGLRRFW
ncbi:MAG: penicillin-binding protein activator LpoB, partial [Syntrophales bacterium]|nr:penicillin-binding protein activator LpoB [Syntrophales bacterium]